MTASSALDTARAAAADRRWADAYERLAGVDATDGLEASDLDLLATVALLRGEPKASVDVLTRAYEAHVAGDDLAGAARSASWLAMQLIELGDFTRSVLWAARAMRVAAALPQPGALAGFVRLAPAVGQLGSGNPAEAKREFDSIDRLLGDKLNRPWMAAVALTVFGAASAVVVSQRQRTLASQETSAAPEQVSEGERAQTHGD